MGGAPHFLHWPAQSCLDVVAMSLSGSQWNATKKTGTSAVPAGKVSFFFDLDPSGATKMAGWAHMAQPGFVDPYWVPVFIEPGDSPDAFTVTDDMSRPVPADKNRWGTSNFNRWFEVRAPALRA